MSSEPSIGRDVERIGCVLIRSMEFAYSDVAKSLKASFRKADSGPRLELGTS
jgi:hypothetical protein